MRRLVASGLLPERAGQPVKVWAHVSLAELRALDDGSVLAQEWVGEMAVRWAARRAAASQAGGDGAAWLAGKPARAMACDAAVIPVVTGGIDPGVLDDLVGLCLQYAGHGPRCAASPDADRPQQPGRTADSPSTADQAEGPDPADRTSQPETPPGDSGQPQDPPADGPGQPGNPRAADPPGGDDPRPPAGSRGPSGPRPPAPQGQEMLRQAIIGRAVDLVSGPGGLASLLRTGLLGARLAGPSLPLDVGHSAEIPAAIRRAVILRDQHCRWAGGYFL